MLKTRQRLFLILIFLLSLGFFGKGLCPSVYVGDNGDFFAAAATLGIAHPTGYPTFLLLGRIAGWLPLGEYAWRLNLMAAFFGSLTLMAFYWFLTLALEGWQPTIIATLILMGTTTLYSQSVILEVYTLNTFLITLTLSLFWLAYQRREGKYLTLACFCLGLTFTNHLLIVLIVPALFYLFWQSKIRLRSARLFFMLALALGLYLYLPLRSAKNPPHRWTELTTFNQFFAHVNGAQYRYRMLDLTKSQYAENIKIFAALYFHEFSPCLLIFLPLGLYYLARKQWRLFVFTLLIVGFNFGYNLNYYIPLEIRVYYLPATLLLALVMGVGIWELAAYLKNNYLKICCCLVLATFPLLHNFQTESRRAHFYAADLGANILKLLPQRAIFLVDGDSELLALSYKLHALGKREDLRVINRVGTLFEDFYQFRQNEALRDLSWRAYKERQLISTKRGNVYSNVSLPPPPGFSSRRRGFLYEFTDHATPSDQGTWRYLNFRSAPPNTRDEMTRMLLLRLAQK